MAGPKRKWKQLTPEEIISGGSVIIDYETLLKEHDIEQVAEHILEASYGESDYMKKDTIDRFLDFAFFKAMTGYWDSPSDAFPCRRMSDRELESRIVEIINVHLYPEIVLKLLKFFTRNLHDPDSNLFIANMIQSREIIKAVYDTFVLFRKDVFEPDRNRRCLNVKRIQQFSPRSDDRLSSPLDAAARFKYVLEFILLKINVSAVYTPEDLRLAPVL